MPNEPQPRILYIEDNYDNQRLVNRVLTARGYHVEIAPNGRLGLAAAQEHIPDLILMDINLPGLNGYEMTTKLKAVPTLSNVPIVAITANTMPGDRERALAAGCDGYISKPIDPRALPTQIAGYLGGSREMLTAEQTPAVMREYSQQLVTRLEEHIRELEATNARLMALDRAKNEFMATISHELRTPLTVIHGYIDLCHMQALGPLNERQAEAIGLMRSNSQRLMRHINDLIYLQEVRSSELQRVETNLAELVKQVCSEVRGQAQDRHQTLHCTASENSTSLLISADQQGVASALRHLLDNAVMYTQEGGQISVALLSEGTDVVLRVRDNGPGIAPADQERIFEPFVRLDTSLAETGGAGLGLVIARHVAGAHGGSLTLHSKPGTGSTFTLRLPIQAP